MSTLHQCLMLLLEYQGLMLLDLCIQALVLSTHVSLQDYNSCMYMYALICLHICMYIHPHGSTHIPRFIHIHTNTFIYMYLHVYLCIHIYMYQHTYIFIPMSTYVYLHLYLHTTDTYPFICSNMHIYDSYQQSIQTYGSRVHLCVFYGSYQQLTALYMQPTTHVHKP